MFWQIIIHFANVLGRTSYFLQLLLNPEEGTMLQNITLFPPLRRKSLSVSAITFLLAGLLVGLLLLSLASQQAAIDPGQPTNAGLPDWHGNVMRSAQ